ncbi:MAG: peptidase domain-containing ABC transporter [Cyanobacteria bacterium P01_A01_bin.135]
MTYTRSTIQDFLERIPPFNQLPEASVKQLASQLKLLRYRMGQAILVRDKMPANIAIIYEGQARLLAYDPRTDKPQTLQLLQPGAVMGWVGLIRGVPCETAIASTETICLTMPALDFLTILKGEPALAQAFRQQTSLLEAFELIGAEIHRRAIGEADLKQMASIGAADAIVETVSSGSYSLARLDANRIWFVSGGGSVENHPIGTRLPMDPNSASTITVTGSYPARLVGFPAAALRAKASLSSSTPAEVSGLAIAPEEADADVPYAPERPEALEAPIFKEESNRKKGPSDYPFVSGRGQIDSAMACFQMLARHYNLPFRRDVVRRVLSEQVERMGGLSLELCGAITEMMGLQAQMVTIPTSALGRLEAPVLTKWQDSLALIYDINPQEAIVALPESGVLRRRVEDMAQTWGEEVEERGRMGQALMFRLTKQSPQKKFGLSWFLPSLTKYKRVLIEVFIASFFVQLFQLANPLMIQVIIDRVIVQNSADTLQVLGIFLLVIAIFEAVLTSLRTYLFVDTTNRIDMTLGSEIIDHLLRLPLRYFERRPVGELSTRINELENIRQFLTGTALTVVLDAIFSVLYIAVMFVYSWLLTLVSLATVPLFVGLAFIASPAIRRQLRQKAERNAETQSYLVEVMSGIQTVKAQNMELRARWQWQQRYARYVSAGFKTVLFSTAASSTSGFFTKLSGLLVLWVGASLVLSGDLTLGQLIAFRIISGYVTTPLLRLAQLWQNFQETALSIERLSDIVDARPEADETERQNIPLPPITGRVAYDNVSFRFKDSGPMVLNNVNVEFEPGVFVGIVGQSGSGKSTMTKLLPRLYELEHGRILVDGYDISKVELYSLRQQIGIVPQESLLFEGTIQENIALTIPDASSESIIEAAKVAAAHDFIMDLPNGYNTRVGERGASLSGGQRQRIAIARTVLQNPRMLIMDESTSALDYDTERRVCLNLADAFQDRTVFFITHRLSTIRNADVILMMDKGSIVEQGTHAELMELQGRYYCLYQQQEAQS